MKLAISQPTYLPWHGYFGLIDFVDEFVFLENVQFSKRSWQQRNKIRDNKGEFYLTLPVKTKNKYCQKIYEVELDNSYEIKKKLIKPLIYNSGLVSFDHKGTIYIYSTKA